MSRTLTFAPLTSRALIDLSGPDWRGFLQGLITQDVETLKPGEARFAAPADRGLPPGRHELHREILMNHMLTESGQAPTRHRNPRRRLTRRQARSVQEGHWGCS